MHLFIYTFIKISFFKLTLHFKFYINIKIYKTMPNEMHNLKFWLNTCKN